MNAKKAYNAITIEEIKSILKKANKYPKLVPKLKKDWYKLYEDSFKSQEIPSLNIPKHIINKDLLINRDNGEYSIWDIKSSKVIKTFKISKSIINEESLTFYVLSSELMLEIIRPTKEYYWVAILYNIEQDIIVNKIKLEYPAGDPILISENEIILNIVQHNMYIWKVKENQLIDLNYRAIPLFLNPTHNRNIIVEEHIRTDDSIKLIDYNVDSQDKKVLYEQFAINTIGRVSKYEIAIYHNDTTLVIIKLTNKGSDKIFNSYLKHLNKNIERDIIFDSIVKIREKQYLIFLHTIFENYVYLLTIVDTYNGKLELLSLSNKIVKIYSYYFLESDKLLVLRVKLKDQKIYIIAININQEKLEEFKSQKDLNYLKSYISWDHDKDKLIPYYVKYLSDNYLSVNMAKIIGKFL